MVAIVASRSIRLAALRKSSAFMTSISELIAAVPQHPILSMSPATGYRLAEAGTIRHPNPA